MTSNLIQSIGCFILMSSLWAYKARPNKMFLSYMRDLAPPLSRTPKYKKWSLHHTHVFFCKIFLCYIVLQNPFFDIGDIKTLLTFSFSTYTLSIPLNRFTTWRFFTRLFISKLIKKLIKICFAPVIYVKK